MGKISPKGPGHVRRARHKEDRQLSVPFVRVGWLLTGGGAAQLIFAGNLKSAFCAVRIDSRPGGFGAHVSIHFALIALFGGRCKQPEDAGEDAAEETTDCSSQRDVHRGGLLTGGAQRLYLGSGDVLDIERHASGLLDQVAQDILVITSGVA
jgi:hypothetical protein